MRRLLLVLLIGCGGAQAPAPILSSSSESASSGDVADPDTYEELQVFFTRKRLQVSQCYNDAFAAVAPKLRRSGHVTVQMDVTTSGKAEGVHAADDTLGSKEVQACVLGMVSRWSLPHPPKKMAYSYSYDFKPE